MLSLQLNVVIGPGQELVIKRQYYVQNICAEIMASPIIFQVGDADCTSSFYNIKAGVFQGSLLGAVLYTLYTADHPQSFNITITNYTDDTVILDSLNNSNNASEILQEGLKVHQGLKKWRIKASASKYN